MATRTWLPWFAFVALMAVAAGGATWSALTGDERRVAVLAAYAERVCVGGELYVEIEGGPGHETLSTYREWPTAGDAKRDLQAQQWRLRALPPPGGLGRFHAAALDALQGTLSEVGALVELAERDELAWEEWAAWSDSYPVGIYDLPGFPVRVYTIPMGGLPASPAIRYALRDLPEETYAQMRDHGCRTSDLIE